MKACFPSMATLAGFLHAILQLPGKGDHLLLRLLRLLIIQFQNTKLLLHSVLMKRPTQLDNHIFCHERAARCPPPFFAAWAATRV